MLERLMEAFKTIDALDIPREAKDHLILQTMAMILREDLLDVA